MSKVLVKSAFTVGLLLMLLAVPVYGASVNKSIKVEAGSESDGATSVNGSVTVGAGAVVTGTLKTVNGKVRIAENADIRSAATVNGSLSVAENVTAEDLSTVNGSISVGENSTVTGAVEAVNGRITLEQGARVSENVGNVNGDILLEGSEVGGDVNTVSGDVDLRDAAVIRGDLLIEKPSMWSWGERKSRMPTVTIGPGSRVGGKIILEREVKLYISETAEVGGIEGEMSMSDAVRFGGKRP